MANAAMATGDYPQISASQYASTTYGLGVGGDGPVGGAVLGLLGTASSTFSPLGAQQGWGDVIRNEAGPPFATSVARGRLHLPLHPTTDSNIRDTEEEEVMANPKRRLVQVLIMDPNENVPLESCLLYRGDQKLTDATDAELYFEIDIKDILAKHNQNRVKLVDKKVKERVEYLEPAKIRDLKMVVVTVAEF